MDDVGTLLLLSLVMLVGCYLAGSIPLAFTFSEEKLKLITVLGAGLLVGTALAVIIPEGVHTMYDAQRQHSEHHHSEAVKKEETPIPGQHDHDHSHGVGGPEPHTYIGVALVLGFLFMLLIDQLSPKGGHTHVTMTDPEATSTLTHKRHNMTATVGLVVHAAADGIALGAAASTSQTHVEIIVFIAIMLHKAPAAFGLVSFLLHEGFERNRIRRHLAVFSFSAPLLAIITFFGLSQQNKETLTDINATGIAMLFSGGTFLYVATVHILPELAALGSRTTAPDGTIIVTDQKGFTKCELLLMVIGAVIPLLLSLGHHH